MNHVLINNIQTKDVCINWYECVDQCIDHTCSEDADEEEGEAEKR